MIEKFMQDIFEKGRKESGSQVRDAVVKHIQDGIGKALDSSGDQPMSAKTLERYHKVYMEKQEYVEGFKVPDERFKHQLAKYLGYNSYHEYTAHIHREEKHKTVVNIADTVNHIETWNGDMHIGKKDQQS